MQPLETSRLLLRDFKADDFAAVHSYASCEANTIHMIWGPNTEDQTRAFIRMAVSMADEIPLTNHQYAAVMKKTGALIGACNLAVSGCEAEVGWILHRDYWRQGYGTEMGMALLRHGFEELGLHRILAHCDADNTGSYRVMEKIGMRREGVFIESRPANKLSGRPLSDELSYAMLRSEWETNKEIAFYNALPCTFDDFIDLPSLSDGCIHLVCAAKKPAVPEKKWVPSYDFFVCMGSEKIGDISLRIGYGGGLHGCNLYYGGQIGYGIDEGHRGNGYAVRACRLLAPVARAHQMEKLLITNAHSNAASRRVCEKLGARLLRVARLPQWHDLYMDGHRFVNVFEWQIS